MSKVSCEHYLIPVRKVEDCIFCQDLSRSNFSLVLDAANAPWLLNDVALLSTKTGEQLLLTLLYDGRRLQLLEIHCSFWVVNWEIVCLCNSVVDQEHQPCHLVLRKRLEILKVMSLWNSDCEGHLLMLCKIWLAVKSFLCMVGPQITLSQLRWCTIL
ncbi:hypothetical protein SCA6_018372 [Theobroma cacao]